MKEFNLTKSSLYSFDKYGLKVFRDNWREYFQDNDERECEIFQKINNNEKAEGSDIYLPLFFNQTSDFFNLFKDYKFYIFSYMDKEIDIYDDYINQRFVDENIDIHRPLLKPKDLFVNSNKIKESLPSAESVSNNIFGEINFSKGEDFLSKIKNNSLEEKKIVFATNIQSEYESFVKKFSPKIKHIPLHDTNTVFLFNKN